MHELSSKLVLPLEDVLGADADEPVGQLCFAPPAGCCRWASSRASLAAAAGT